MSDEKVNWVDIILGIFATVGLLAVIKYGFGP